jgi:hypothetical protein
MKWIIILSMIANTTGYHQAPARKMEAAMDICLRENLTRENVMQQVFCVNNARRRAAYEIHNPYVWNVERSLVADYQSALQYANGEISREKFFDDTDKHWKDAIRIDEEQRAKDYYLPVESRDARLQFWII